MILLDLRLPDVTGMEVLKLVAGQGLRFAVVMLTGMADVSLAVRAMKGGAVDFIEKPFSPEALLTAIRECFARLESVDAGERAIEDARFRIAQLSGRERDVLCRLLAGWPNKIIALLAL